MKKLLITSVLLCLSHHALAVDCKRPIKRIFTGYTTTTSLVDVDHGDGYEASVVRLAYVNDDERIVDRILSVLLTAHMGGGKSVRFRYAQALDGSTATCTPTEGQEIQAVWIE